MRNAVAERQFPMRVEHLPKQQAESPDVSWPKKRLLEIGVLHMSNTQPQQPGFYINWTTLSAIAGILALIGGLFLFTANTYEQRGRDLQKTSDDKDFMQKQIDAATVDAKKAKDIALGSQADQSAESDKEKKKK